MLAAKLNVVTVQGRFGGQQRWVSNDPCTQWVYVYTINKMKWNEMKRNEMQITTAKNNWK